jgi:hypothetical protein
MRKILPSNRGGKKSYVLPKKMEFNSSTSLNLEYFGYKSSPENI